MCDRVFTMMKMGIDALGYIVIISGELDNWARFGARLPELQLFNRTSALLNFRMDDRKQRLFGRRATPNTIAYGWEVVALAALETGAARLKVTQVRGEPIASAELPMPAITGR